ncbi:hypothetical protein CGC48_00770 [Capnocytophaga cynodegmi]|uniref:Uncharacterized protein n=1 Tax=Capnocytophaga cynodegmi TaxID=28189 RepID=A0A250E6C9_9FLAO|nr:hypothetical protein [Capnocytophaga cynodegmi]ATA67277.1 hypothetical protein CGC48_00770 [Capnocytophaga cynodegmi]
MKTNKLNSETVTEAVAFAGGAVVGSATSRVLADKIPLKNSKLKRGLLAVVGVAGAAMISGKDNAGKVLQGAAAGMAATQLGELVKEMVNPQEGILKTALGTPENPIAIYPSDVDYYDYETLDNPYEEQQQFLAAPEEFAVT